MNKRILVAILAAFIIGTGVFVYHQQLPSSIQAVSSFIPLEQKINNKQLDHDSLVIFDIDNTLLMDEDPWEHGYRKERAKANTIQSLYSEGSPFNQQLDRQTRDKLWSIYAQSIKQTVVDKGVLVLIKELQAQSIKIIGLTRFLVGKIGTIESLEDFRNDQLAENGFDFSSSFPQYPLIIFKQFSFEGKHPLFKNGVLYTTLACSKGELLKAFLQEIGWKPNKVIMFDDKVDQLKTVQDVLKQMGIPFEGFEYTAVTAMPAYFDKSLAEFQMQYLMDHEQWLTGSEAQAMLEQQ